MTTTTATLTSLTADALTMSPNGVASGCRGIDATMRDENGIFAFQLVVVAGKARSKALFAWLKERAQGRGFHDLRVDAHAWIKTNPRGKRSGFVAPAAA